MQGEELQVEFGKGERCIGRAVARVHRRSVLIPQRCLGGVQRERRHCLTLAWPALERLGDRLEHRQRLTGRALGGAGAVCVGGRHHAQRVRQLARGGRVESLQVLHQTLLGAQRAQVGQREGAQLRPALDKCQALHGAQARAATRFDLVLTKRLARVVVHLKVHVVAQVRYQLREEPTACAHCQGARLRRRVAARCRAGDRPRALDAERALLAALCERGVLEEQAREAPRGELAEQVDRQLAAALAKRRGCAPHAGVLRRVRRHR
mmetsp:Transcript_9519/g.39150  ORF Transcript_9519/g.39150 Transcript_9519/m.39150 type:complete len:265 (-) Transcript_9519:824-1618(-)